MHPRVIANAPRAVIAAGVVTMLIPVAFSFVVTDGRALAFGLPAPAEGLLTFLMLTGRLVLFTALVLLTPALWRG